VRNMKLAYGLLFLALSAAWLLADTLMPDPFTYFPFRSVFVQYTGIMGLGMMSVAMMLATRPTPIERPLHGLDKMYRLHKWLGITGLVFAVMHWWWVQGTRWMVAWGWLVRPPRKPSSADTLTGFEQWLRGQRGLAESLGEWAFYIAAVLIILALVKSFPYHLFRKTHKLLAVVYLVLVYHGLVLMKYAYWTQPVGWIMALLMAGGSVSALLVLTGQVGKKRKVSGVIRSITEYPGVHALEIHVQLDQGWKGHRPGQFAFVTSKRTEGAHPYTIACAWNADERDLMFVVKELGDWTGRLRDWLKVDMPVMVEGPYGCFDFDDSCARQIWIGAGIGITPFIARMKYLARTTGRQQIDLFHVTSDYDQAAIDRLTVDARAANVNLHVHFTPKDGLLTPEKIRAAVPEWRSASLWFCGPVPFGDVVRKDFLKQGMPKERFHQELFMMR
jgi:predicted ferric reductase